MIRLNTQPVEKQVFRDDGALEVVEVWRTIQGEGPLAGTSAIFVRLAGCNLQCPACDTDYTSYRKVSSVVEIAAEISLADIEDGQIDLVVLTGGEPFRQNIRPLVEELIEDDYRVQIETNGTLFGKLYWSSGRIEVVCSPKTAKLSAELEPNIDAYKYILEAGQVDPDDGLPLSVLGLQTRPARPRPGFAGDVFVQPQDDQDPAKNKANIDAAVASCMKYGYRLSLQTHKILGLP